MKRLLLSLSLIALLILASCSGREEWYAMDKLQSIDSDSVESIDYSIGTEGGVVNGSITDKTQIEDVYLRLTNVKIKGKTQTSVLDDGLIINVKTQDETLTFVFEGDILSLDKNYEVENLGSLKKYLNGLQEQKEEKQDEPKEQKQDEPKVKKSYDIMDGFEKKADGSIEYLYFNDFMMAMPNNEKWSFEHTKDSVTFYLFSAQQENYGGRLVSIIAYDMDDDSYKELPSYHEAGIGKNSNKRFIAEYPTDVQWNPNDKTQDKDYRELADYLKKIGDNAVNSPVQTADGD